MNDPLVQLLIRHCLAGIAAGWITVALILWTDLAGVGTLAAASDLWPIPHLMLFASFGLTFGAAAMGAGVMGLGHGAAAEPPPAAAPVPRPGRLRAQPARAGAAATRRSRSDARRPTTGRS